MPKNFHIIAVALLAEFTEAAQILPDLGEAVMPILLPRELDEIRTTLLLYKSSR